MPDAALVMLDEELKETKVILNKLLKDSYARVIFLVDKDGQLITSCGEDQDIDSTSLASLTAGNIAATEGLAKLLGQKEFSVLFHQGEKDNIHLSVIQRRMILVVIFDDKSTLGLIKLRVKKACKELSAIIKKLVDRATKDITIDNGLLQEDTLLTEITDEDIERLFR
ncbi:MAG: roadblock/LC7 domain-containing protein [Thermodesulfobacteriota bacterium]